MSDINDLAYQLNQRRPAIHNYERYFDGTAPVTFVGESLQQEFGQQLKDMFVNRCAPIIETTLDRLAVQGFEAVDGTDEDQDANRVWKDYQLARVARNVHFDALTSGDGWVLVWPEQDGIKIVPQEPSDIAVRWSAEDPNVIEVAAKTWQLRDGRWRMNVYNADRLEKFITSGPHKEVPDVEAAWAKHEDKGDLSWPIKHNMGRVPIFHFSVRHRAGVYGRSDLAAVIPLQDRLNLSIANQAVAEEFQSFRQRWATGIQPVRDEETGEYVHPFSSGADRLWVASGDNVKFGEFDGADLVQFETVIEGHEKRIARTARIPMHFLVQTGTPPSGEALKTAEAPFVSKVKARQNAFGDTWAELVGFVLELEQKPRVRLITLWVSAETRDETRELERALMKQQAGVSRAQTLRELRYTNTQIEQFPEEDAELLRINERLANEGLTA